MTDQRNWHVSATDHVSGTSVDTGSTNELANPVIADPWQALRQLTAARIALGRSGISLPTGAQLAFQLAHAQARDAVHLPLDAAALQGRILQAVTASNSNSNSSSNLNSRLTPTCHVLHSAAQTRDSYLQRPDLGRQLDATSRLALQGLQGQHADTPDLAIVIADGLSALAIEQQAMPFLQALLLHLVPDNGPATGPASASGIADAAPLASDWSLAPLVIVLQGRVAIGDEIGQLLGAKMVLVLIGERPGLSSPDSMGLYLTWAPRIGLTDECRNCISNVRPAGLSHQDAARKTHYLLEQARQRGLTGIHLKDEMTDVAEVTDVNALTDLRGSPAVTFLL
jgi:ethanolamine ammonia-lyase small subunit